ncbi:MAG: aromatic-ring-hydroxylating dioxygenase subunit beta [Parvibaculaceae bacterium]|nr:aromatic-ring-hydroxylating dioxygenase subunit beta [Parvibaculaceae bacterium]
MSAQLKIAERLSVSRTEIEDFLFEEAALLDDWKLTEWLALFEPGASYHVPPAGSPDDADPAATLFYVMDDYHRLSERVKRLLKRTAHVEYPHSRCRHMISNVRILGGDDRAFTVTSNFATYRSKRGRTELYFGHHNYVMTRADGSIRIRQKTSFLDSDDIAEQGKVSIII